MDVKGAIKTILEHDIVFLAHTSNNNMERIQLVASAFLNPETLKKATELYRDHAILDGDIIRFDRSKLTYNINDIKGVKKEKGVDVIYICGRNFASAIYILKKDNVRYHGMLAYFNG